MFYARFSGRRTLRSLRSGLRIPSPDRHPSAAMPYYGYPYSYGAYPYSYGYGAYPYSYSSAYSYPYSYASYGYGYPYAYGRYY